MVGRTCALLDRTRSIAAGWCRLALLMPQ